MRKPKMVAPIVQGQSGHCFVCKEIPAKLALIPSYLAVLKGKYQKQGLRLIGLRDESEVKTLKPDQIVRGADNWKIAPVLKMLDTI